MLFSKKNILLLLCASLIGAQLTAMSFDTFKGYAYNSASMAFETIKKILLLLQHC